MKKKEIEKNYKNKIAKLRKYDQAYFDKDEPIVSDKDYEFWTKNIEVKEEIVLSLMQVELVQSLRFHFG